MPDVPASPAAALLERYLETDAPQRESEILRMHTLVAAASGVLCLAFGWSNWTMAWQMALLAAGYAAFWAMGWRMTARGSYYAALSWVSVAVEVTVPVTLMIIIYRSAGVEAAFALPVHGVGLVLILMTALRSRPELCLFGGALAAAEGTVFWLLTAWPPPAGDSWATLPASIAIRTLFTFAAGVGAALIAKQFRRKSAEALSAIRAQDWMSKYVLEERLGKGGMAEVWKATYSPEGGFARTVAVKKVLPELGEDPRFVEMFREEAHLCASLTHPNVVQVLDVGRFDGRYVLAMEYVDGLPLHHLLALRSRPLPFAAVTYVAAEMASALDYLHRKVGTDGQPLRLVHRDVNPPNILVSRIAEVKLADFGVARAASRATLREDGTIYGKLGYLAPEQALGLPVDGRADLYNLGLVLHELVTGKPLVEGDSVTTAKRAALEVPPPPSALRPDAPPELDAIVMDLLAHDPARRPQTGAELRARLLALAAPLAPYPDGQAVLARAVKDALADQREALSAAGSAETATDPGTVADPARTRNLRGTPRAQG